MMRVIGALFNLAIYPMVELILESAMKATRNLKIGINNASLRPANFLSASFILIKEFIRVIPYPPVVRCTLSQEVSGC